MIDLALLKLFIDDRNSVSIEKRNKQRLYQSANHTLNEEGLVMTQNNEEVKTDLLHTTAATTPRMSLNEMQGTSNTTTNALVTEDFPLLNSVTNQKDGILTGIQTQEFESKDRMSTKVIDDTTLRIYFPKAPNADY